MKTTLGNHRYISGLLLASTLTLLAGCATTGSGGANVTASDPTRMTKSGFLSNYAKLKTAPVGDGVECWRATNLNAKDYNKVMFSRIVVSLAPPKDAGEQEMIDPSDLKTLTDYFHGAMVKAMKPGSVIVDLAAAQGGNCPLTEPGQTVVKHGVTLVGETNLPALVAADASALYARNVIDFLKLVINKEGQFHVDLEDDIVKACLMCRDGQLLRA